MGLRVPCWFIYRPISIQGVLSPGASQSASGTLSSSRFPDRPAKKIFPFQLLWGPSSMSWLGTGLIRIRTFDWSVRRFVMRRKILSFPTVCCPHAEVGAARSSAKAKRRAELTVTNGREGVRNMRGSIPNCDSRGPNLLSWSPGPHSDNLIKLSLVVAPGHVKRLPQEFPRFLAFRRHPVARPVNSRRAMDAEIGAGRKERFHERSCRENSNSLRTLKKLGTCSISPHPDRRSCMPRDDDFKVFSWITDRMSATGLPAIIAIVRKGNSSNWFLGRME